MDIGHKMYFNWVALKAFTKYLILIFGKVEKMTNIGKKQGWHTRIAVVRFVL